MNIDWVRSGILDRLLDEGYRVVGYDARGHGLSDKPHGFDIYDGDTLPNDARALLDELGIDSCVLVGFSLGARTALRVAALDDRVTAVVALGSGELRLQRAQRGMSMVPDAMLTDDPESIEHESIRHFREMADAIHADREALASAIGAERPELIDFVDEITVPVLVITGVRRRHRRSPDGFAARAPERAGHHHRRRPRRREGPDGHAGGDRRVPRSARIAGEQLHDPRLDAFLLDTARVGDACREALLLFEQPEEEVFGPDVVVPELERGRERELERAHGARRERRVADHLGLAPRDDLEQRVTSTVVGHPVLGEHDGGQALRIDEERQQQVLGAAVTVPQLPCLLGRERDHVLGAPGHALGSECDHRR